MSNPLSDQGMKVDESQGFRDIWDAIDVNLSQALEVLNALIGNDRMKDFGWEEISGMMWGVQSQLNRCEALHSRLLDLHREEKEAAREEAA